MSKCWPLFMINKIDISMKKINVRTDV